MEVSASLYYNIYLQYSAFCLHLSDVQKLNFQVPRATSRGLAIITKNGEYQS